METRLKAPQKPTSSKHFSLKWVMLGVLILGSTGLWFIYQDSIRQAYYQLVRQQSQFLGLTLRNIKVQGYARTADQDIYQALGIKIGDPLFWVDTTNIYTRLKVLPWVADVIVERKWPHQLLIHVQEKVPMARWQKDYKVSLVDTQGQVILGQKPDDFKNLPLIIGQGASHAAKELLENLNKVPTLQPFVIGSIRIGQRRWNLVLPGNKMALLPELNQLEALQLLETLRINQDIFSKFDKTIDLRVKDKIVLR